MFHIYKATRLYYGIGYRGSSAKGLKTEVETLEEAKEVVTELNKRNGVGWIIRDTITNKNVFHSQWYKNWED